jgi:S-adenosylmethionine hydrolase
MNRATLLTDFGTRDGYVAAMKGVIATIAPSALVDDASHDIPPGDILAAAFALRRYWKLYPRGTVHVVVVDPGVGSERAAVAMEAESRFLVGPDNGVFTFIEPQRIVQLETSSAASHTFHGRDVFAPAAGRLLAGEHVEELGVRAASLLRLDIPKPDGRQGEVIAIDRFGNLITNFTAAADVEIQGVVAEAKKIYSDVADGELLTLVNSDGWLEIAARNGSAAQTLGVTRGAVVRLRL